MDPVIYFFADWLVGLLFLADADKFIIYFVAVWAIVCFWLILESFIIFFFAVWCGFSPYFHRSSPPRAFFWRSLGRRGAVPGRWTHPRGSAWRLTATLSSSTLATPEFRFSEEDGGSALRYRVLNYPYKTISCFLKILSPPHLSDGLNTVLAFFPDAILWHASRALWMSCGASAQTYFLALLCQQRPSKKRWKKCHQNQRLYSPEGYLASVKKPVEPPSVGNCNLHKTDLWQPERKGYTSHIPHTRLNLTKHLTSLYCLQYKYSMST